MIEDDKSVDGLLVLLNTVGGDVEAGLAIAEMIASLSAVSYTHLADEENSYGSGSGRVWTDFRNCLNGRYSGGNRRRYSG